MARLELLAINDTTASERAVDETLRETALVMEADAPRDTGDLASGFLTEIKPRTGDNIEGRVGADSRGLLRRCGGGEPPQQGRIHAAGCGPRVSQVGGPDQSDAVYDSGRDGREKILE